MRLHYWISVLLALSAAPAVADSYPVEFEGVRMDVPYGDYNDCARDAEATVQLSSDRVLNDPDALQSLVRGLAEKSRETCGSTMSIELTLRGPKAVKQVQVFSYNYWNLPKVSLDNAARAALMSEIKEAMTELRNAPPDADAEMSYRGYERALLLHEEPRFSLYAAVAGSQDEHGELVMVHRVPASDPFLPTKVGLWGKNHRTVQLAPEFYDMFDRGLANAGPFAGHYLVRHYLEGYYQPLKNRTEVLAKDGVVERPLQRHNFSTYWDGTRLRATPIPRQYLHEFGNEESLVIDRERAEIKYGASAPGPDGTVVAATAQVSVSPEGPSAEHLYRMRLIRESAQQKRLIYRNDAYWTQFNSDDLRSIFNAHGEYLAVGDPGFSAILMNYLAINSQTCRTSIANPAPWGLKEITVTTDGWNNRSVSETVLWDMVVPARFVPHLNAKFQPERANAADTIGAVLDTLGSGGFGGSSLGRDMLRVRESVADIEAFMAQVPCGGPMQRQMEEMLFHHLAGINPTRQSDLAFTGDDPVIEPLYEPGSAQTLKTACLANRDFGTDRDDFSRCGCIAEKMQRHAPDKVAHYTENFSTWFRDVKKAEDALRAQGTEADRALYATHRQCMAGMH